MMSETMNRRMRIEVISCYYHEEKLIPLFMQHYESWVDRVTLLTDKFHDGKVNCETMVAWFNDAFHHSQADWVVVVDTDEFVFPDPLGSDPRKALESEPSETNVIYCSMYQVWRHRTDSDVDYHKPPAPQRRHGEKDFNHPMRSAYIKPCLVKPEGASLSLGNHSVYIGSGERRGKPWIGAHWSNADQCFAIQRRIENSRDRMSDVNRAKGWAIQNFDVTVESISAACEAHLDDPLVF